jgi:hypothetical protein
VDVVQRRTIANDFLRITEEPEEPKSAKKRLPNTERRGANKVRRKSR